MQSEDEKKNLKCKDLSLHRKVVTFLCHLALNCPLKFYEFYKKAKAHLWGSLKDTVRLAVNRWDHLVHQILCKMLKLFSKEENLKGFFIYWSKNIKGWIIIGKFFRMMNMVLMFYYIINEPIRFKRLLSLFCLRPCPHVCGYFSKLFFLVKKNPYTHQRYFKSCPHPIWVM